MIIDAGDNRQMLIRSNALMQAVYRCSMTENKILLHALYDARQSGRSTLEYTTSELAELTSISATHSVLHKAAKNLDSLCLIDLNSNRTSAEGIDLIQKCSYSAGLFVVCFNQCVFKYLTNLQGSYTSIDIMDIQLFCDVGRTQNFTWRLYELLKTVAYKLDACDTDGLKISLSLAELKLRTGLIKNVSKDLVPIINARGLSQDVLDIAGDLYPLWSNFRSRILDPAIAALNDKTIFDVSYEAKKGNNGKIIGLAITLNRKKSEDQIVGEAADKKVKTSNVDTDAIDAVRSFIEVDLNDEAIASLIDAAQGDIGKIRAQYNYMQGQIKEGTTIHNIVKWLKAAIKHDYAASTSISCTAPRNKSLKDRHVAKYGFTPHHYDFDALEKELLGE